MKHIYAEMGFGNDAFFSTEIEDGDREYRVAQFIIPKTIHGFYLRFWIFKTVFIFSTNSLIEFQKKNKSRIKILFGISGTD